ncbi:hypothetical protein [Haladaptatus pallidirubidus]|uniref:hypothetical protein n=1 Tax=Haladaptatus pallidirubidus TaxID=1008152 RepID=UPI001D0FDD4E|nr:hypothetical protein [Haladaptatus pallidirubidus]
MLLVTADSYHTAPTTAPAHILPNRLPQLLSVVSVVPRTLSARTSGRFALRFGPARAIWKGEYRANCRKHPRARRGSRQRTARAMVSRTTIGSENSDEVRSSEVREGVEGRGAGLGVGNS